MKAAVWNDKGSLDVLERQAPDPRPGWVRLRVAAVGICGTDREISDFHYGTPPAGRDALVIGHEALGEVTHVGASVSSTSA